MANVKITELTALTTPVGTDVLPIVDVLGDVTKKVTVADLNSATSTTTTDGDIIIRSSGSETRLPIGSEGQALLVSSGLPVWGNVAGGYTDPLTTDGDIVIRSGGVSTRLGIGSEGQVLKVSSGLPVWAADAGGDVVLDTTPQLGGNLDVNGNYIVSASGGNVEIAPDTTGSFVIRGNNTDGSITLNCTANTHGVTIQSPPHASAATYTLILPDDTGTSGQVLSTNGTGTLSWLTATEPGDNISTLTNDSGFITSTVTGDFTVDTNSLYVDSANNRVGIGTTSPSQSLDLESSTGARIAFTDTGTGRWSIGTPAGGSTGFSIYNESGASEVVRVTSGGKVGINESSPSQLLSIDGSAISSTFAGALIAAGSVERLRIGQRSGGPDTGLTCGQIIEDTNTLHIAGRDSVNGDIIFHAGSGVPETMRIDASNNRLGVGTSSPAQKLDVKGNILASADAGTDVSIRVNEGTTTAAFVMEQTATENTIESGASIPMRIGTTGTESLALKVNNTDRLVIANGGDVSINTDTLYVDTVNNRVGINTASPSEALDIQGGLLINGANVTAVLSGTIADDAFYSLDLTAEGFMLGGLATITTFSTYDNFPQAIGTGMFYYDCGNSLSGARILSDADAASPLVGGTTSTSTVITDFTDGRATIICNANTLRIANRLGGNRRFKLTFL